MKVIALATLLMLCLGGFATAIAAGGDVVVIQGKDSADGSDIKGLRLSSESEQAYLFFLCDSDKQRPQIMINHRLVIGKPADPFKVFYQIDDQDEQRHWFLVRGSGRTDYFFVRFPIEYKKRFGEQPLSLESGATSVNPAYLEWDRRIYNTVIHDFLSGGNALLRIQDKKDQDHLYAFSLKKLRAQASVLDACYSAPLPESE